MSDIPKDLLYSKNHEWVRQEDDDVYVIGITDYAQTQLGDLVFVDLPEMGAEFERDDDLAVVESVKTAADVYCPLSGEVVAVNETLINNPGMVNQDPYGDGWLVQLKIADSDELDRLFDADAYATEIVDAEDSEDDEDDD